jgi:hypothetical protein
MRARATSAIAVLVLVLQSASPSAQTTTLDGVHAFLRGDYQNATRILGPLATRGSQSDPTAQFFMGLLYGADSVPGCVLLTAAAAQPGPLASLAGRLVRQGQERSPGAAHFCAQVGLGDINSDIFSIPRWEPLSISAAALGGVDAILAGDYAHAAEILKPLAERPPGEDVFARFFLGAMYIDGKGVPQDDLRACALYARTRDQGGPLAEEMRSAVPRFQLQGRERFDECIRMSSMGFSRFESAMFWLESNHRVKWDENGVTVTFNGSDKHFDAPIYAPFGTVFEPVQHTELFAGTTRPTRRHFVERFIWTPNKTAEVWTLHWYLFEIVRDEFGLITEQSLETVEGSEPPDAIDLHQFAQVRVNGAGDVEWALLRGEHPQVARIETDEEWQAARALDQAERDRTRARAAADAQIDWSRVLDPYRPPSLHYADADGCSNVFLYGWNADRTETIAVNANGTALSLLTASQSFEVGTRPPDVLDVTAFVYEKPYPALPFCTDLGLPLSLRPREERWRAVRGLVTIQLSAPGIDLRSPFMRRATIVLSGAEFVSAYGARIKQTGSVTLSAMVGWLPG